MRISTIILDWAGTAVDFGSNAPVAAFLKAFEACGVRPAMEEVRAPMGMQKRAHIAAMLQGERLGNEWVKAHGRAWTQRDVDDVYAAFEPALFAVLPDHATPLPGVLDAVAALREMGLSIGSTTGYTRTMMDVVAPAAKAQGYAPDCLVCPDDVGGVGRPYPYMLWRNLELLGAQAIGGVLKVGDTAADVAEAKNAGCFAVGVVKGSNVLGLGEQEFAGLTGAVRAGLYEKARRAYTAAGADYVLNDVTMLPGLVKQLSEGGAQ